MKKLNVPELELKILGVLWSRKEAMKVQEILDAWNDEPKPGYTTILKKLQVMESKEFVSHKKSGRSYSYFPLLKKMEVTANKFGNILQGLFRGDRLEMAASFVEDTEMTADEIDDLIKMLEKKRGE